MKWIGRSGSKNILDRRGGTGLKLGIGGIIIALLAYFIGGDPSALLQILENAPEQMQAPTGEQQNDEAAQFVSVVLKDTEDVWSKIFQEELNADYTEPRLVLFTREVRSACGFCQLCHRPLLLSCRSACVYRSEFLR